LTPEQGDAGFWFMFSAGGEEWSKNPLWHSSVDWPAPPWTPVAAATTSTAATPHSPSFHQPRAHAAVNNVLFDST
jgi:hypothetical protein